MKVYIVLDLARVQPLLGCYSCAVDAAEHCKRVPTAFTYTCRLNAELTLEPSSPEPAPEAAAS